MEQNLYYYKATVKEVKDADTIVLDIDCGFDIWLKNISCRLSRIDAYEIRLSSTTTAEMKQKGLQGREFVKNLINEKDIIIKTTIDKEKYGRVLCEVFYKNSDMWVNLNDELVAKDFAIYKQY